MTSPQDGVELRPAPQAAVLSAASLVVGLGMALAVLRSDAPLLFVFLFLAAVAGICGYNLATALSSALARPDGSLEIRNRFRTRRLDRSEIDRVLIGSVGGFGTNRRIELLLVDGTTVPLVATETPPFPGPRRRLDEQAAELGHWVGPAAQP